MSKLLKIEEGYKLIATFYLILFIIILIMLNLCIYLLWLYYGLLFYHSCSYFLPSMSVKKETIFHGIHHWNETAIRNGET